MSYRLIDIPIVPTLICMLTFCSWDCYPANSISRLGVIDSTCSRNEQQNDSHLVFVS